jgi:hypothetical protein
MDADLLGREIDWIEIRKGLTTIAKVAGPQPGGEYPRGPSKVKQRTKKKKRLPREGSLVKLETSD